MGCGNSTPASGSYNKVKTPKGKPILKSDKDNIPDLRQEPEIEEVQVSKTESGYPPVKVPLEKRETFFVANKMKKVDERARKTSDDKSDSYKELIAHLTGECNSDLEKVRAIFMWLGTQSIATANYSKVKDANTPRGFMKLMKDNKASYASFFAVLCRHAGIPCVIVEGYAKGAAYKVGDTEERVQALRNTWNAVYVAGEWRIVFPRWACVAVVGRSSGTYTKVEVKGQAVREKEQESAGETVKRLNDYYFFTDPEEFIYIAYPIDKQWQLLKRPWTLQQFADAPYCRQTYFRENVRVESEFSCRLKTKDGTCNVEIGCDKPEDLSLDYELYYNHKESGKEISDSVQLNNFVMLNRSEAKWNFDIRFPDIGVYKLQIVGGRGYESNVCAFEIFCNEVLEDCKPYPFNPGKIGYGPNADTEIAGVEAVSHKLGIVNVNAREEVVFNFNLTQDVAVKTELVHSTLSKNELSNCVKQTQEDRNVNVQVSIPENGEYALTLHTKQKNEEQFKNVCNYLLTSEDGKKKKLKTRENQQKKELNKFDDKVEMSAEQEAERKKVKQELKDAIKQRNLETLEKVITHAKESKIREKVAKQIAEAEEVRDHLKHLNKIAHDVLEMKQTTIAELKSYKFPSGVIIDVMRSTFLMLGEEKENVEKWEDLQKLMGKLGKDSMLRRVRQFDTVKVQPETKLYVDRTLQDHTETEVRVASAGAGTFYVWLRNVSKTMDDEANIAKTGN